MSYTTTGGHPEDLTFYCDPSGILHIKFTCPRCELKWEQEITPDDLVYGFEVHCRNNICAKGNQRPGYILTLDPRWQESIMGQSDRPLDEEDE